MTRKPFVPDDFPVPAQFVHPRFKLRMLTVDDVISDYEAVMSSRHRLRGTFGPGTGWPKDTLTIKEDLIDLGWHQFEFQHRRSFTYTVVRPQDEHQIIGTVYILPADKDSVEAEIYMWVSDRAFREGLEPILFQAVKEWIKDSWPFEGVAYPGREMSWEEWKALP